MKFKDYETQRKAQDEMEQRRYEEVQPRRDAWGEVMAAQKRVYEIGLNVKGRGMHGLTTVRFHPSSGIEIRIQEGDHHYSLQGYQLEFVSSKQWQLVAEIVEHIERWRADEIDELQPSCRWEER